MQTSVAAVRYIKMTDKQWGSAVHFPLLLCSGSVEKEVGSVVCDVAGQTRESGFALAGNGYLRSWKWSGPFWHFHSPAGKSNLQQKTERLKKREGETKGERQSERWGWTRGKWLHERVKNDWSSGEGMGRGKRWAEIDKNDLEVMQEVWEENRCLTQIDR